MTPVVGPDGALAGVVRSPRAESGAPKREPIALRRATSAGFSYATFSSTANTKNYQKEYQGLSDSMGRFSLRLPAGDVYQYYTLNTIDSTLYKELEIPALKENFSYKAPFVITYYLDAPKNFILEGLNFDNGKYSFQPTAYPVMDDLVEYMKRKEDDRIEIGGHTDNVGNAKSNLKLSEDRANAVKDYLVAHGIDTSRIITKGYGSTVPLDKKTMSTVEGRAENRRTEVTILE